ncbi:MAG TPA: DDE-type integrase/transposase/recombinase [Candidatus Acidoferrum sp.]|nr:DDE-type integrase/transposase/recombinase [Candidatus Acidoferrum sp.]
MTETNSRQERGKEIAEKPDQVRRIDEDHYQVKSQSSDKWYDLISTESGWKCSCPDNVYRKVCCKHVHCLEISLTIRQTVKQGQIVIEQINSSSCPYCKSDKIIKRGLRHNKYGDIQRFCCNDCTRRFTINLGFQRMKSSPQTITSAMQLYFTGESLRNVQKFLKLQGAEVSHKTVYVWIKKYVGLMEKYLEQITPQVSDKWRADELFLKVRGNTKYLYALMDDDTRFWIAKQVADTKYTEDVRPLFSKGKQIAGKRPLFLVTDGARNFYEAFNKEFWSNAKPRTEHIRHVHFKGDLNNNKMERLNGEIRDREKVVRGLKKMDSPLISGYQIYHNYIRPHMALDGQTPADKAGIKIEGENKWKTLIQRASL